MTITVDNYIVCWNPINSTALWKGLVKVGKLGDNLYWDRNYIMSGGMCYTPRRSESRAVKIALMMIDFHTLIVRDGLNPIEVHKEFLKIKEYRTCIAPDIQGAIVGDGVF